MVGWPRRRVVGPVLPVLFAAHGIGLFFPVEPEIPPTDLLFEGVEGIKFMRPFPKSVGDFTIGIERRIHLNRPVGLKPLLLPIGPQFCRIPEGG